MFNFQFQFKLVHHTLKNKTSPNHCIVHAIAELLENGSGVLRLEACSMAFVHTQEMLQHFNYEPNALT